MKVEVTDTGAIYVNDTRITDRSTKPWGGARTVDSFECHREAFHDTLAMRGHTALTRKIDTPAYA